MSNYFNAEINFFAILILLFLFRNIRHQNVDFLPDQKMFLYLVGSIAAVLFFDSIQWIVSGMPGNVFRWINILSGILYYTLQGIPCMVWCLYVRFKYTLNMDETMKIGVILLIIGVVNTVLSFVSGLHNAYFYIDGDNIYHRGQLYWLFILIQFSAFFYALLYVFLRRKEAEREIYVSLLEFAFPPLLGGGIQAFCFGASLVWPCATFAILITYINIQNGQLYTDHLTGLRNRRLLDTYLDKYLRKTGQVSSIGAIMMDINGFKSINDKFGHTVGDEALVRTADIIRKSVSKDCFIARYGGDEFVLISNSENLSVIAGIAKAIENAIEEFNRQNIAQYTIKLSFGFDIFECGVGLSRDDVLNSIDRMMYAQKKAESKKIQ